MSTELRYESSPEHLDAVEPLWSALHAHHAEITPVLAGAPAREAGERHGFERGFFVYFGRRDGTRRVGDPGRD